MFIDLVETFVHHYFLHNFVFPVQHHPFLFDIFIYNLLSTSLVWQLQSRPRKRRAKFWRFDLRDLLIQHILVSEHRQQSAEDDSSEDHEDNTGLLNLVLRAAVGGVSSDDDEETSDGSE
jgi:hypothetical protein